MPPPRNIISLPTREEHLSEPQGPWSSPDLAESPRLKLQLSVVTEGQFLGCNEVFSGHLNSSEVPMDYPRPDWMFPSICEVCRQDRCVLTGQDRTTGSESCWSGSCLAFSFHEVPSVGNVFPERLKRSESIALCLHHCTISLSSSIFSFSSSPFRVEFSARSGFILILLHLNSGFT